MTDAKSQADQRERASPTNPTDTSSAASVVAIGYVVLDIVIRGPQIGHAAGGTAGNVAAGLAWLGWHSSLVARVGNDRAGRLLAEDLRISGVEPARGLLDPHVQTPLVVHEILDSGQHRFLFSCPVCGRALPRHRPPTPEQAIAAVQRTAPSVLFFDRASKAALAAAELVRSTGGLVVFEPNSLGRIKATTYAADCADILKVSGQRSELLTLCESRRDQIQIVTMGNDGLRWRCGGGEWRYERAVPGFVVDSAGAGDWLTVGLLYSLNEPSGHLTQKEIRDAIRFGQSLATLACAVPGARGLMTVVSRDQAISLAKKLALRSRAQRSMDKLDTEIARRVVRGVCRGCLHSPTAA